MATNYYRGQGAVWIADRDENGQTTGFTQIGDADSLQITTNEAFDTVYESMSGRRNKVVHSSTQTDVSGKISILNVSGENLRKAYLGTVKAGAVQTINDEKHVAAPNSSIFLKFPAGSVSAINYSGGSVIPTDKYTVHANGRVDFTDITAGEVLVDYTTTSADSVVEALVAGDKREFVLVFEGKNMNKSGSPVMVKMHRVYMNLAAQLDLLGTSTGKLEASFSLLPAEEITEAGASQFFRIVQKSE